jgi:hypothetical protein
MLRYMALSGGKRRAIQRNILTPAISLRLAFISVIPISQSPLRITNRRGIQVEGVSMPFRFMFSLD